MARRSPPRKVTYFEPVAPRLARNTIIESTFEVGRRFRCTIGAHYVVPDFSWVQDVGGSLVVLADQVRRAVAWVYDSAELLGSDRNQIYIGNQSSGGHLAAVALTTDVF
jgi:hypothetical protein